LSKVTEVSNPYTKLSGGILAYTLGLSIVVSAIVSAIILLGYYHRLEQKVYSINSRLVRNLLSAEQLALGGVNTFEFFEPEIFDLYGAEQDSVAITRRPWGYLDMLEVKSFHGRFHQESNFLVAHQPDSLMYSSFFLMDDRRPLSVVGNTRLSGLLYLPQSGVQSAFIDRQGYQNDSLFYGTKRNSTDTMPKINSEKIEVWDEMEDHITTTIDYQPTVSILQSFLNDTVLVLSGRKLNINDSIIGKVFIDAREVTFDSLAFTENIVVRADIIRFKNGFQGSGQFLASDSLLLQGAKLNYPSIAILHNERDVGVFRVESSSINGVVGVAGDPSLYSQRILSIEDGSTIQGAIYCDGYLEHYGAITGHATVRKTLVNTPNAVYENYLLNAEIEEWDRMAELPIPAIWMFTNEKKISQWLN